MLPFFRLRYDTPNNAIGYAMHTSRSHDAVIRVYNAAGNVIETHEHKGDLKEWWDRPVVISWATCGCRAKSWRGSRPGCGSLPNFDQCPRRTISDIEACSPTLLHRSACYSEQLAVVCSAGVRRADNRPEVPVPLLYERLKDTVTAVVAYGPAIRRGGACHRTEVVILHSTGVG